MDITGPSLQMRKQPQKDGNDTQVHLNSFLPALGNITVCPILISGVRSTETLS